MVRLDSKVVRSGEPMAAPVGDGLVMLSLQAGKYFSLNETAAAIWNRLEQPILVEALCKELAADYGTDAAAVAPSVLDAVRMLVDNGVASTVDEE